MLDFITGDDSDVPDTEMADDEAYELPLPAKDDGDECNENERDDDGSGDRDQIDVNKPST